MFTLLLIKYIYIVLEHVVRCFNPYGTGRTFMSIPG